MFFLSLLLLSFASKVVQRCNFYKNKHEEGLHKDRAESQDEKAFESIKEVS